MCNFDFEWTYGVLGAGYAHIHHVVPLHASGVVRNSLDDLVVVCANCPCHAASRPALEDTRGTAEPDPAERIVLPVSVRGAPPKPAAQSWSMGCGSPTCAQPSTSSSSFRKI
ncbi:hypothetical protein [Rhodococcus aetherivorans]|uniref:hypothetical protein n=1 Tax=Rhodococcus aetherivorans TaxID=191292 RepID=UPI003B8397D7